MTAMTQQDARAPRDVMRLERLVHSPARRAPIARSTAARWVTKARERGLLGPALRARAGEAVPS
jgi:hypothetical protein